MTSPAGIFSQALERLSTTNLSDEVEDINLGGTMLQAANAKSFKQIEAEANEEVRRIVRGQPEYTRTSEHDTRISRGDICDANAWRDAKGATRMFCLGYDAAARRWMALDDVQGRAAINRSTK